MAGYDYIEFTTGGASLQDRLPIVFFFHSLATQPKGMVRHLKDLPSRARIVMPRGNAKFKYKSGGYGPSWWKLRDDPKDQATLARQMREEAQRMIQFIEMANQCLLGVGKPIITGHSQGGMMTFGVASADPGRFKAAVPVSGWIPVEMWPKSLPPTYAVHGTKDGTMGFARIDDFVKRAQSAGLPIELYPIEGHKHGIGGELERTWRELVDHAIRA